MNEQCVSQLKQSRILFFCVCFFSNTVITQEFVSLPLLSRSATFTLSFPFLCRGTSVPVPPPPSTLCTLKTLRKRMNSPPWCLVKLRKKNNPLYIYVVHSFQWKWDESVMTSKASQPFRVSVQGGLRWHALIPYLGQNSCYITLVYPVFSPFSGSSAIVLFWEGKLTLS